MEPNDEHWRSLAQRKCHIVAAVLGSTRGERVLFRDRPPDPATAGAVCVGVQGAGKPSVSTAEDGIYLETVFLHI